ncbi:Isocitrate/isopropylmalate dehydrogenase [Dacryopinax primogenitus]|uniref:Isocitrate/isopropylmalate dehydrogenase n=1 Tax=Dacryopinax primogenitus (strain DJM 731) TaxID=1858805 RepID=M5FNM6_DACPD|nr:Isocitrate/isopropylmalate dehydrogenase [Dacryopinax primogenitus]EJT97695.1 Isocitrate/isopropylmalate dehydrogenase [Dacryopinax primogenitus]
MVAVLRGAASLGLKKLRVGMIPADGVGREVLPAAQRILEALGPSIPKPEFTHLDAGWEYFTRHGVALPEETADALQNDCDCALFGAVGSPTHRVTGYSSPIVALRKKLSLYANVRPVHSIEGLDPRPVDMVIVRENTECLYIKQETSSHSEENGREARATRLITERASKQIGRMAFRIALSRAKPDHPASLTIVHKSNVLQLTDGLFRECVRSVMKENEEWSDGSKIAVGEQIVDSMVYRMFREPEAFDVVVAPNLYGDILSDAAAALVGSLGLVPSVNAGDTFVMGEPVHGTAPDIAGLGIVNPIAAIRSAGLMLHHLGYIEPAQKVEDAVVSVLKEGVRTRDLGGNASTEEVVAAIEKRL